MPAADPPWDLLLHPSARLITLALWASATAGGGGVVAGLAAVRRGGHFPGRSLLAVGLLATAALTVLPPTGSTDALDYAAYGRMVVLGHSPYVMTPRELRATGDPVGRTIPGHWKRQVSLYGPAATAEQWAAASLGGTSAARITFWLKLWNALAFGTVALVLDRMLRSHPSRRARAHLLWSANPLLLWGLVAAGHVDALAAMFGVLGVIAVRDHRHGRDYGPLIGLTAGLLAGLAADIKITYVLFGVGIVWATRRSPSMLLSAVAGVVLVLLPSYRWFGPPAVRALLARDTRLSPYIFYRLFPRELVHPHLLLIVVSLCVITASLALWRLPDVPQMPALRAALALSLAWLFLWPYQLPWYDAIVVCLLAVYPASRLDWLVVLRLIAGTAAIMPGGAKPMVHALRPVARDIHAVAPVMLLAAAACLIVLCISGKWKVLAPTDRGQPS